MNWIKKGCLFAPDKIHAWMFSHAANPTPVIKPDGNLRVFFTCRDIKNHSYISWCDLDPEHNYKVIQIAQEPVISPGNIGLFDDSGTALACILPVGDTWYLYYLGWNLAVTVPWHNSIGLAKGDPFTAKFEKNSLAPLMDRDATDPYSVSYPSVLFEQGKYRMWYGSNRSWGEKQDSMDHIIKYAESSDGLNWTRTGIIALDHVYPEEYALSRPWVLKTEDIYEMWFSYRAGPEGKSYRIGYAESKDGIHFERKDAQAGINVSEEGWDSEMVCYPSVFEFKGKKLMLYNGNAYGKTGFGLAIRE